MRVAGAPGIHIMTMQFGFPQFGFLQSGFLKISAICAQLLCSFVSFVLLFSPTARAHDHHSLPARIITDQQVGPWTISVWAQQHMDTGRFFVQVRTSSGTTLPNDQKMDDLKVEVGVQPASQSSPMTFYRASRESSDGQYRAEAPFDSEQSWQLKVRLQGSGSVDEITTYVGAPPPGLGEWQLLLYALPFLSVGGLWLRVYWLRRGVKRGLALTHS